MNERIKELADKSGFGPAWYDSTIPTSDIDHRWMDQRRLKEFAELIVRECMSIADGQKKYVEDMEVFNEQDATWNRARIQQSQQIVDKIKQHFGVENE